MKSKLLVAAMFGLLAFSSVALAGAPNVVLEGIKGNTVTPAQAFAVNAAVIVPIALAIVQHERCVKTPGCLPKPQKLVWTSGSGQPVKTSAGELRAN